MTGNTAAALSRPDGRASDKARAEIIDPPHPLGEIVKPYGGPTPEQAIARAQRIVKKAGAAYAQVVDNDIDRLKKAFAVYKGAYVRAPLDEMFSIVHNIRGMGTTFKYPLLTRIGTSMCRYITERREGVTLDSTILQLHIDALSVVVHTEIRGAGDKISQQVAAALDQVVGRVTSLELS
ncbi:MAG: hypothetical protein QF654_09365 [Alphaproteobacteria bacterium]|nr:hypothetical protein [Alphaproteobacteria bacterium]MDP6603058.1 hypothetical protein [Rhodospirillales bacterium]